MGEFCQLRAAGSKGMQSGVLNISGKPTYNVMKNILNILGICAVVIIKYHEHIITAECCIKVLDLDYHNNGMYYVSACGGDYASYSSR